jgi:hypothetical protein
MNRKLTNQLALVATTTLLSGAALADVFSEAAKLGANTGAMAYCGDNFADDDDKGRYKMIRLKLLGEFGDLDDGDYLGKKLDADRCTSLRKTLYLKY